jgi:hypothetical protein
MSSSAGDDTARLVGLLADPDALALCSPDAVALVCRLIGDHPLPRPAVDVFELATRVHARLATQLRGADDYRRERELVEGARRMYAAMLAAVVAARAECDRLVALGGHEPAEPRVNKAGLRQCVLTDKMQTRLVGACETLEATIREVALPLKTPDSMLPSADGAAAAVSDAHNAATAALSVHIAAAYSDATRIKDDDAALGACAAPDVMPFLFSPTRDTRVPPPVAAFLRRLHAAIAEKFPGVCFLLTGSHVLGLATPSSDVDITLFRFSDPVAGSAIGIDTPDALQYLHERLVDEGWRGARCNRLQVGARVSVLRLDRSESIAVPANESSAGGADSGGAPMLPIDICAKADVVGAACKLALLRGYLDATPSLAPLIFAVKRLVRAAKIGDAAIGGVNSFGWTLLLVHFMQARDLLSGARVLPLPAFEVFAVGNVSSSGIDAGNGVPSESCGDKPSIASLLIAFFHHMAFEHPYKTARVSIRR